MDKKILSKATAANDEPTAGWMYHAIAKMTKESPSACESTIDWLVNRLNDNNPHTKKKVLVIIKNVAQQGDIEFSRLLTKRTETIKAYSSYRGATDPLHGDALNQAVRVAAQQAVEAIFERNESGDRNRRLYEGMESNLYNHQQSPNAGVSSWVGYGSSSNNDYVNTTTNPYSNSGFGGQNYGGMGVMPSGGGKYQGFGPLASQQQQTQENSYLETIKGYVPSLSGVTSYFSKNTKPYGSDGLSFLESEQSRSTYQVPVMPSSFQSQRSSNNYSSSVAWDSPSTSSKNGSMNDSNTLEQKLVDEFTNMSGVKLQPTRAEVSQFASKCEKVDGEAIAELLHQKVKNKQWQVRLKALYAIEALLKADNESVKNYFAENYNEIGEQSQAVQDSVATKARRILKLLDSEEIEDEAEAVTTPKQKVNTPIEYEPQETQQPQPVKQKSNEQPTFNGKTREKSPSKKAAMNHVESQPVKKKQSTPILLDPFDEPEPPKQDAPQPKKESTPAINSIDDIFTDMTINDSPKTQAPPSQQERKRADSGALMQQLGGFFDSQQSVISPVSPGLQGAPVKSLQQYPPSTMGQPQIVYVPINAGYPMQPMGYPMQPMGYGVQPGVMMQPRIPMQQPRTMAQSSSKGGFDFMNKAASNEEDEADSHFDFVKQEIAQSAKK